MDFILFEALDEHLLFEASLLDPHVNLKVIVFSKALDKAGQKKKEMKKALDCRPPSSLTTCGLSRVMASLNQCWSRVPYPIF